VSELDVPGLLRIALPGRRHDGRGFFQEAYRREWIADAGGPPSFQVVQTNVSVSRARGTTRGFHAEPWSKFVEVVTGAAFGAYLDLRCSCRRG
jgi:dTDP-4-dehydrorhamnose 3,5-epimerase-like enzyme